MCFFSADRRGDFLALNNNLQTDPSRRLEGRRERSLFIILNELFKRYFLLLASGFQFLVGVI